jgi:4-amino-4-deoxy-L-arabinose transferase-like glycosyltransferase
VKIQGTTKRPPLHALMLWMAVGSFAVGTGVRVFAAHNDLWFDEIWTLELLRERVHSFGDVFTNLKHSNNHHLCSLWMWLVGQNASALMYRLPSVLASIGTIVLAGLIGLRQSRLEGSVAVILTSWSYLLIHFGTEARGYSLAIFFALLAWYALQRFEERRSWIWIVVFWSAVMLGFLAHLEFAVCFAGLVVWSLWRFTRNWQKWRQAVLDLFALFTVPVGLDAGLLLRSDSRNGSGRQTHVSALAIADQDGFLHARRACEWRCRRNHSFTGGGRIMCRPDLSDG